MASSGIILMPIPVGKTTGRSSDRCFMGKLSRSSATRRQQGGFLGSAQAFSIRHDVTPRKTLFHPGAQQGPELQDLLPTRKTVTSDGEALEDQRTKAESIRTWKDEPWTGKTFFAKQPPGQELEHTKINDVFLKLLNTSSQGGYAVIYYDKNLETETTPQMV